SGIDADDADSVLLRAPEVLQRPGAEGAIPRAPAPHDDEPGIDVVRRFSAGTLVVGLGAVGHVYREHLGLGRDVGPDLCTTAEAVEQPPGRDAGIVQHRETAGSGAVEDSGGPVGVAHAAHLSRDLIERVVPRDALELAGSPRPRPAQWIAQPVRVI